MGARAAGVAVAASFAVALWPTPVRAEPLPRRVIVVTVAQESVAEWRRDPVLAGVLRDGASALLSTRTAVVEPTPERRARAAYATLGAGARAGADDEGAALAQALHPHVPIVVSPSLQRALAASRLKRVEGAVPGTLAAPAVAVIDAGTDTTLVARARRLLNDEDVIVVLAPVPADERVRLGVIAIVGGGHGSLASKSTRRSGVVTLADVAPTVLRVLAVAVPASMEGRPLTFEPAGDPVSALAELEQDLRWAARARTPVTRAVVIAAMVLLAIAVLALLRGWWSRWIAAGLVAVAAAPAIALVIPLGAGAGPPALAALWVLLAASIVGLVTVFAFGAARALAVVGAATVVLVIGDLVAGAPMASRSPMSFVIAWGDRFYGIGNEYMGAVIAGSMLAMIAFFELAPARQRDRFAAPVSAALAAVVGVMSVPVFGAKLGATVTAVPALGIFIARVRSLARPAAQIAAVVLATLAVAGIVYVAGAVAGDTHIGRSPTAAVVSRKVGAAARIARFSIWTDALLVFAAAGVALWFARRDLVRARIASRPVLRAAFIGGLVAVVCSIAFNDAGIVAAAIIVMMLAPAFLVALSVAPLPPASPPAQRPPSPLGANS